MAYRGQPISEAQAFELALNRIRDLEDAVKNRLFPPGYNVNIVAGNIVVTRDSDGAITTLVFA